MSRREVSATTILADQDVDVSTVTVVAGPDKGVERGFVSQRMTVGKGPAAGLQLTDPSVSRLHCELEKQADGVRLRDLGSRNGTWIAGCRVHDVTLSPGVRVSLGESVLEARTTRKRLPTLLWTGGDQLCGLRGASHTMHALFARIAKVAPSRGPVLVRGESGTGKELVARTLHALGRNPSGPFVTVDAGALSRSLADLELFGNSVGAFTGATAARRGAFERASGGTLFLDEVGEMPLELQPKLLRAIEDGTVLRLGESERRTVDVRLVAATHRDLARMVAEGSFREDLYFRLAVLDLEVPPLRDRPGDVERLAAAFVKELAPDDKPLATQLQLELSALKTHRWPGNVRELRAFVHRAVVLGDARVEQERLEDRPLEVRRDLPFAEAKRLLLEVFERTYLERLLDETGGNVAAAARRSELARSRLYELLEAHRLRRGDVE